LGDSIATGTQDEDQTAAVSSPFTDISYPQFLFGHLLEEDVGFDTLINLACPADSSAQFLDGNVLTKLSPTAGSYCYGDETTLALLSPSIPALAAVQAGGVLISQLQAAKIVLATTDVGLITLTIGGNDLFSNCRGEFVEYNSGIMQTCILEQYGILAANLNTILATLSGIAPDVPIMVTNYFAPFLAFFLDGVPPELRALSELYVPAVAGLNSVIAQVVDNFATTLFSKNDIILIDLESAFDTNNDTGTPPKNVVEICENTYMCKKDENDTYSVRFDPNPDIHPNTSGHRKIAGVFAEALDEMMSRT
jgi:lysophospholipase L1-like esterase